MENLSTCISNIIMCSLLYFVHVKCIIPVSKEVYGDSYKHYKFIIYYIKLMIIVGIIANLFGVIYIIIKL